MIRNNMKFSCSEEFFCSGRCSNLGWEKSHKIVNRSILLLYILATFFVARGEENIFVIRFHRVSVPFNFPKFNYNLSLKSASRHRKPNMAKCRICEQPLIIELDPDSFDEAAASSSVGAAITAPDDLLLPCGCHFHWLVASISIFMA